MVDDVVARTVELGRQRALGDRHADRVGDALTERARWWSRRPARNRTPGDPGLGMQLAEILQVIDA